MTHFAPACQNPPYQLTLDDHAGALAYHVETNDGMKCGTTLKIGFFFDGTSNNLYIDADKQKHSNIARLHNVFEMLPDQSGPARVGNRFRHYAAGVGTPFEKEVGDTGRRLHAMAGMASGWGGESRIVWALLQLQNDLHAYYFGQTLSQALGTSTRDSPQNEQKTLRQTCQDQHVSIPTMNRSAYSDSAPFTPPTSSLAKVIAISYDVSTGHNYDAARKQILAERTAELKKRLGPWLKNKPQVEAIHLSVFGFSRGAAEARVFMNWLREVMDEGGTTLAGIAVTVIFAGLFDTVASVGYSEAVSEGLVTGHGGWARTEDLVIPPYVRKCLHLVASQEVRGSFPSDAASAHSEQYVYPGMHSDVGGGYLPGEQGRSPVDAEKLSQIPLGHMYRAAVAAGVPLNIDTVPVDSFKADMQASPALITAFNAYVEATKHEKGNVVQLVHAHYTNYLRWRRLRLDGYASLPVTQRANTQDQRDLIDANEELRKEAALMADLASTRQAQAEYYQDNPMGGDSLGPHALAQFWDYYIRQKTDHWGAIKAYWDRPLDPDCDQALITLFDNYVHDSRASFKPLAKADSLEEWQDMQLQRMKALQAKWAAYDQWKSYFNAHPAGIPGSNMVAAPLTGPPSLTASEQAELDNWQRHGEIPPELGGREFSGPWGYLRFRVVFDGSDTAAKAST